MVGAGSPPKLVVWLMAGFEREEEERVDVGLREKKQCGEEKYGLGSVVSPEMVEAGLSVVSSVVVVGWCSNREKEGKEVRSGDSFGEEEQRHRCTADFTRE
ncbi:hypothetical protein HAX54_013132 [Datura stramonium]|uniref:Uncharacterized protein n=1 Tax=Datura stramonium TaxID=4076 RepID=A0ABS8TKS6_DATST|nr:hypothetical protein [Datura stramonium]